LAVLKIDLGKVPVADDGARHFLDGGAIGFDGQISFSEQRVNAAELCEKDSGSFGDGGGIGQDLDGLVILFQLDEPL
jgi:hypothetical protein